VWGQTGRYPGPAEGGRCDESQDLVLHDSVTELRAAGAGPAVYCQRWQRNVTTNGRGLAVVSLPDYFEALNRDFRYQLTVIGQFQAIVAKEISRNRFTIRTSRPNVKVSWQVTGIRHDAYADAHRIQVEEEKPSEERGKYLHPELFGASQEQAIGYHTVPSPGTQLVRGGGS